MRELNKILILFSFILFSVLIFSCSKKEQEAQVDKQQQNKTVDSVIKFDSVKTAGDSLFSSSNKKFTSKDVRKKFLEIKKKYENKLDEVGSTDVRFNDLDSDGKEEAVLYYGLVARGGNIMTGSGLVIYRIEGDKLEFLTDYNLDGAVVKSIKDGQLNCVKYEYATGDPSCCPSKKKPFKLKLENNKLNFIP